MSVTGVIEATRTALASVVTAGGLTCLEYENVSLDPAPPVATLELTDATLGVYDQRIGFETLTFTIRVYVTLEGSAQVALANMDAQLAKLMNAIGSDLTLGGKVTSVSCNGGFEIGRAVDGAQTYVLAEWTDVEVKPFPNAA